MFNSVTGTQSKVILWKTLPLAFLITGNWILGGKKKETWTVFASPTEAHKLWEILMKSCILGAETTYIFEQL